MKKQEQTSPVKKSADTIVVVYLPKKIKNGGPGDGSAPGAVASILRRVELERVLKPELEQRLLNVQLTHPRGNYDIWNENNRKWTQVLKQYLVDEDTMEAVNGGTCYYDTCSSACLDEEYLEEGKKYQFIDTARFALNNCKHASQHLQCILSYFIKGYGLNHCPIHDTLQCKYQGEAYYWAPEDYYNFAKAFLRTKPLTDAFLKPEYR